MGLEESREVSLPKNINNKEIRNDILKGFDSNVIMDEITNTRQKQMLSTLSEETLSLAGEFMKEYFEKQPSKYLKLLEIMAGSRVASTILRTHTWLKFTVWITTDICLYDCPDKSKCIFPFYQLNAVDAVNKFGAVSNVLLLVSPMPSSGNYKEECWSYADYYACHDFIEQKSDLVDRYIVFIGELGASDGTAGMYEYLNENDKLQIDLRKVLLSGEDIFGGECIKEIFIYRLIK